MVRSYLVFQLSLAQTSERGPNSTCFAKRSKSPGHLASLHSLRSALRSSDGLGRLGPVLAHDGQHAQVHELGPLDDVLEGGHEVGGEGLVDEPESREVK